MAYFRLRNLGESDSESCRGSGLGSCGRLTEKTFLASKRPAEIWSLPHIFAARQCQANPGQLYARSVCKPQRIASRSSIERACRARVASRFDWHGKASNLATWHVGDAASPNRDGSREITRVVMVCSLSGSAGIANVKSALNHNSMHRARHGIRSWFVMMEIFDAINSFRRSRPGIAGDHDACGGSCDTFNPLGPWLSTADDIRNVGI